MRGAPLAAALLLATGCASTRTPAPASVAAEGCVDGSFRGRYTPAEPERPVSFRAQVRRCPGPEWLLELRGLVGGAALVAAVREGGVRLVFPRDRRVVDGADAPEFWERYTGVPLSGRLLDAMLARREETAAAPGWRVRSSWGAGEFPRDVRGEGPRGARLRLSRVAERAARGPVEWPAVPRGFERIDGAGGAP